MNKGTLALSLQRMNGNDRRDNFRKHEDAEGTQTTDQPAGLCIIGFGSIGWTPEREREEVEWYKECRTPPGCELGKERSKGVSVGVCHSDFRCVARRSREGMRSMLTEGATVPCRSRQRPRIQRTETNASASSACRQWRRTPREYPALEAASHTLRPRSRHFS